MKRLIKPLICACLIIITATNGYFGYLGYTRYTKGVTTKNQSNAAKLPTKETVKQQVAIKSKKAQVIDDGSAGNKLGEGDYKYETLDHSKVNTDENTGIGKLIIARHEASKAHFILAVLNDVNFDEKVLNKGWTVDTLSVDGLWAPGGCASKPTQLLGGRYIFIDDGKTNPEDKYNSYIFYDIQDGKYKYFGGNKFTPEQGENEHIVKVVNENDRITFYIEKKDKRTIKLGASEFEHIAGQETPYLIRRVVDTSLHYTDYKLPYTVPDGISNYQLWGGYGNTLITLSGLYETVANGYLSLDGNVKDNKLVFTYPQQPAPNASPDTDLELLLDDPLQAIVSNFNTAPPYEGGTFKTNFRINELGSFETTKYIIAGGRFGDAYQTPATYGASNKALNIMTNEKVLKIGAFVALGVY